MRDEKYIDEKMRTKKCQTKKCRTKNGHGIKMCAACVRIIRNTNNNVSFWVFLGGLIGEASEECVFKYLAKNNCYPQISSSISELCSLEKLVGTYQLL